MEIVGRVVSPVIVVLRHPWFAISNASGAFTIRDVPPGEYRLHVFHERATESTLNALARVVSIAGDTALPPIAISETGYVEPTHKNKYGMDYPPVSDESGRYPGRLP